MKIGGFKIPSPMKVVDHAVKVAAPPVVQKVHNFATAPIKSMVAADPIMSWVENDFKFQSHGARTKAGIHAMYKEDRIAQALGVREKDVVTVFEVAQVAVGLYFGGSYLLSLGSGSAGAGAAAGTAAAGGAGAGTAASGVGVAGTVGGYLNTVKQAGAVVSAVTAKPSQKPAAEPVADPQETAAKQATPNKVAAGVGLAVGAVLLKALIFT